MFGIFFVVAVTKGDQPEDGEEWVTEIYRDDNDGHRYNKQIFRYNSVTDCIHQHLYNIYYTDKKIACGLKILDSEPDDTIKTFGIHAPYYAKCSHEKTYYYLELTLPGGVSPTSSFKFKPSLMMLDFPAFNAPDAAPKPITVTSVMFPDSPDFMIMEYTYTPVDTRNYSIAPSGIATVSESDSSILLRLEPRDKHHCVGWGGSGVGLYNVKVEMASNIMNPSAHTHFAGDQGTDLGVDGAAGSGKGRFVPVTGFPVDLLNEVDTTLVYSYPPYGSQYNETYATNTMSGKTADKGDVRPHNLLEVTCKAGLYGIGEEIVAKVSRDPSDPWFDPKYDAIDEVYSSVQVTSRVPDLVELPMVPAGGNSNSPYVMAFGNSCGTHEPSARWVSGRLRESALEMAWDYSWTLGTRISFNDASLPYGGVIDKSTNGWGAKCHNLHRDGNHIDVNSIDEAGFALDNPFAFSIQASQPLLEFIGDFEYVDGIPTLHMVGPGVTRLVILDRVASQHKMKRIKSAGLHYTLK